MSSAATNATTAPATGAGAAAAGAGGQAISSDEMLVYNVDLVLLLLVGIFVLVRLPRAPRLAQFYQRMAKWAFSQACFDASGLHDRRDISDCAGTDLEREFQRRRLVFRRLPHSLHPPSAQSTF